MNRLNEFFEVTSNRIKAVGGESFGGTEGRPATYQPITIDGVEVGYVRRTEAPLGAVIAHALQPDKYPDHYILFVFVVNPLDKDGNEINFANEVGNGKDLSFPNEDCWEVRFQNETEFLKAFDTLQDKYNGAVFDFSKEALERMRQWERTIGINR